MIIGVYESGRSIMSVVSISGPVFLVVHSRFYGEVYKGKNGFYQLMNNARCNLYYMKLKDNILLGILYLCIIRWYFTDV